MSADEKLNINATEYDIPIEDSIRDDAKAEVIMNMYENNFNLEQIAVATKKTIEEVKAVIEKMKVALV